MYIYIIHIMNFQIVQAIMVSLFLHGTYGNQRNVTVCPSYFPG